MRSPFDKPFGIPSPFGGQAGGVSYSAEATAYFAAMSVQPTAERKALLDAFISSIVGDGLGTWAKLTWLSIFATEDEQQARVNVVNPAQVATIVGTPIFTADLGYAGDGVSAALASGVLGTEITSTDHTMFVMVETKATSATRVSGYQATRHEIIHGATSAISGSITSSVASTATTTSADKQFVAIRRTGTSQDLRIETGNEGAATATNSTSGNTNQIRFLGAGTQYSNVRLGIGGFGLFLSDAQCDSIRSAARTYLTAIGWSF